jgi:hypothetical protein
MSRIVGLKLVTGEELVAELVVDSDDYIFINNPLAAVLQRGQNGPQLGFMPWMPFAEGQIKIKLDKLVALVEVDNEIKNQYNTIFGTGIVTPSKQLITG